MIQPQAQIQGVSPAQELTRRRASKRLHIRIATVGCAAALVACQQEESGNDPNAMYAYLNNKHTFIVSHVFTKDIYQKNLNAEFAEVVNPDAPVGGTYTCFYEIMLEQPEMDRCAATTGITRYSQTAGIGETGARPMTETDVWRLMAINPDKVAALNEFVIPTQELVHHVNTKWVEGSDAARTLLPTSINRPTNEQVIQKAVESAMRNSTACAALARAAKPNVKNLLLNIAASVLPRMSNLPMFQNNPLLNTGAQILGHIGRTIGGGNAQRVAEERCQQDADAARIAAEQGHEGPQGLSPAATAEATEALRKGDTDALRAILAKELERDIDAIKAVNPELAAQLAPHFLPMTAQKLHAIRENIKNAAVYSRSLNTANGTQCVAPARFANDVLKGALVAGNTGDTISRLNRWTGCADGGAAANTTTSVSPSSSTNTAATQTETPAASPTTANRAPEEVVNSVTRTLQSSTPSRTGEEDPVVPTGPEPAPDVRTEIGSTMTTVQRYMFNGTVPAICFESDGFAAESKVNSGALPETEFQDRAETCNEPLSTEAGGEHTFGRFSDRLRNLCARNSEGSVTAQATCYCSCRWNAEFHKYLSLIRP